MNRRTIMTLLGGAAALPIAARGQQANKIYRIGFLANDPAIPTQPAGQAFLDGLRDSGFVESKNVMIDRRFGEGRLDRYAPPRGRTDSARAGRSRHVFQRSNSGGETGDDDNPHYDDECLRSHRARHSCEPSTARRQHHRRDPRRYRRNYSQATAAPQRCRSACRQGGGSAES